MKKMFALTLIFAVLLTGCISGITQEEYDKVIAERDQAYKDKDLAVKNYLNLQQDYDAQTAEIEELKRIIEPYKKLSEAELLEKTTESELKAKENQKALELLQKQEDEEKAKKEVEEKAAREAEEKLGYETGITYDQIARTPDNYMGKKVKFTGEAIQVIEGDIYNQIRLAINSDYDKIILIEYDKKIVSSRILEDDIITIYGVSTGLISYKSTLGGTITIPSVFVEKIDQ